MAAAVKPWRRTVAVGGVLLALAVGLPACGSQPERRAAAAPTASPAPNHAAAKSKARAQPARLTRKERRQARRLLERMRKATPKPPRSVVTDSGVIP